MQEHHWRSSRRSENIARRDKRELVDRLAGSRTGDCSPKERYKNHPQHYNITRQLSGGRVITNKPVHGSNLTILRMNENEEVPVGWKTGCTVKIPKKGILERDPTSIFYLPSYRSTLGWFSRGRGESFGRTLRGRSCTDQIARYSPLYVSFVNFKRHLSSWTEQWFGES